MDRQLRVYIAGPYTKGDPAINTRTAMHLAHELLEMGFAPYCPHLSHFMHLLKPQSWDTWMDLDLAYLEVCDVLVRIPGESRGATIEEAYATKRGIPTLTWVPGKTAGKLLEIQSKLS